MPASRLPPSTLASNLLYSPGSLPAASPPDVGALLTRVNAIRHHPLNERQARAFASSFEERLTLLWGPPGTGKTATLGAIVLGWLEHAWECGVPLTIGVGSSNWNAIDNVLTEIAGIVDRRAQTNRDVMPTWIARVRGQSGEGPSDPRVMDVRREVEGEDLAARLADPPGCCIVGGTWLQLVKMRKATCDSQPSDGWFDLLVIDEASQVKVAEAAGYFALAKESANVVLAGDHRQLGPVYPLQMPDDGGGLLDCVFKYMRETHQIAPVALRDNYRTNQEIADWPNARFYESDYEAATPRKRLGFSLPAPSPPEGWPDPLPWDDAYRRILDPAVPIAVITYPPQPYSLFNPFEAQLASSLTLLYRLALGAGEDAGRFWKERCGVVTPHRAQMAAIRGLLIERAGFPAVPPPAVDTVDRFQGQERDLIIASYAVAEPDFVAGEEAFILDPRRFNVTLTRARGKFILLISDAVLQHLPSEADAARDAAHLQLFVEEYCDRVEPLVLPWRDAGRSAAMPCRLHTVGGEA
jgi:hypothetical protein